MGREIVYCWKCAKRLEGADFDDLKAYRYGDKVSCDECVYDLVGDLPAEEQEAILSGQTGKKSTTRTRPAADEPPRRSTGPIPKATTRATPTTRTGQTGRTPITRTTGKVPVAAGDKPRKGMTRPIPKVEEPVDEAPDVDADAAAKKKKLILIGAGGGGLLLIVIVVIVVVLMGGKKPKPAPVAEEPVAEKTEKKPDPAKSSREIEAKKAYDAAMAVFKDKPLDLVAQLKALKDAEPLAAGTSLEAAVAAQIVAHDGEVDKQLAELDGEVTPLLRESLFKGALDALNTAVSKYELPKWKSAVERKIEQTKSILEDRFLTERKAALLAKENEENAKVDEIVAKVSGWNVPELVERLKKDLAAVATAPDAPTTPDTSAKVPGKKPKREFKEPSKEMQGYMPSFQRAAGLAFQRDYDAAAAEARRAGKEFGTDETLKESELDAKLFEEAKAWVEAAVKLQPSTKRLEALTLEFHEKPGEFKTVSGRVTKVFDQRFEFKATADKDGKKITTSLFVEHADLTGKSLAEQVKKLRAAEKGDAKMAAVVCLLEGDEAAAAALGGRDADALPDRWWQWAPEAKEKCPKTNAREFEARNLFHKAEAEYANMQTRAPALEKYKTLQNEFGSTRIVKNAAASIAKRGEVGKEYVFNARSFKSEGAFKPAKKPDLVLQGTKDVDVQEMRDNYVEAEFYALANTSYRCWAYVGACCKETFSFYLQTTDRTTSHQGKQLAIDPGANMAEQVKHQISGLKADHAAHAPKDKKAPHPKDATRWEWVPVPLAKVYAAAGAKGVRLMTDQAGFAVKYIVVSSTRQKVPDEKDMAEFLKQLNEEPAGDDSGVKGTPEPKEWLIAGPFNEPLNTRQAPENEIDLAKEMTGKNNKKFKWKVTPAAMQGAYATFNWEDGKLINPKDGVSAYVLIHVKASAPMSAQLSLGHDDGARAWVNGEMVHSNDRGGGVKNDEFKAKAALEEGWNRILVKVRSANGGFGLSFRILDDAGNPAQGLEYSPYGDQLVPP